MEPLRQLRTDDVVVFLRTAAISARAHAPGIDRLDRLDQLEGLGVEPGGNTGSNVAATLEAIVGDLPESVSLTELAAELERRADRGVGTAGRLVAAFLAGMSELFRNADSLDAERVAMSLEAGAERLVEVIGDPRPGSLPVVADAVVRRALHLVDSDVPLDELVVGAAEAGLDALEETPRQWEPLAEAGVVDAGAAAFLVLVDALVATIHGEEPEEPDWDPDDPDLDPDAFDDPDGGTSERFRWEVSLQIDGTPDSAALLGAAWRTLGDSITIESSDVDEGATLLHARIRTDDVGPAIEAAIGVGRPHHIVVADTRDPA